MAPQLHLPGNPSPLNWGAHSRDAYDRLAKAFSGGTESQRFDVAKTGLSVDKQRDICKIAADSAGERPGMLRGLIAYVAAFFECLFSGDFTNYYARVDEKKMLPVARRTYDDMVAPQNGYSKELATSVSGVSRDDKGNYEFARTPQGEYIGMASLANDWLHKGQLAKHTAIMRGEIPSDPQVKRMEAIYKAKITELYSRSDIQEMIRDRKAKGLEDSGLEMQKYASEIVDAIANDKEFQELGTFGFRQVAQRNVYKKRVAERIFAEHEQHVAAFHIVSASPPAAIEQAVAQYHDSTHRIAEHPRASSELAAPRTPRLENTAETTRIAATYQLT